MLSQLRGGGDEAEGAEESGGRQARWLVLNGEPAWYYCLVLFANLAFFILFLARLTLECDLPRQLPDLPRVAEGGGHDHGVVVVLLVVPGQRAARVDGK